MVHYVRKKLSSQELDGSNALIAPRRSTKACKKLVAEGQVSSPVISPQFISPQFISPAMIEPIMKAGNSGYVPLCSALYWIMTDSGTKCVAIEHEQVWEAAGDTLFPLIHTDEITLVGLPRGAGLSEKIPGHLISVIKALSPLTCTRGDILVNAPSHIYCIPFLDREYWSHDFNDRLYITGQADPAWTHLQVCKTDILSRWARPSANARSQQGCYSWLAAEMEKSPHFRPRAKNSFWAEANVKFKPISRRQFLRAWDQAVDSARATAWTKGGRPAQIKSPHQVKS
jgi:hypothetical protein